MDGASERTNKTINQSIHFHVEQNQKGWVCALPHILFYMMNTINASTGYSGFQLHLGHSPHLIPPIIPISLPAELHSAASVAESVISRITMDITDAKDNLLLAKPTQASGANKSCEKEICY